MTSTPISTDKNNIPSASNSTISPKDSNSTTNHQEGEGAKPTTANGDSAVTFSKKRAWPTPVTLGRTDRLGRLSHCEGSGNSSETPDGSCTSPPEHLHANKWAQIIIRARQRQNLQEGESSPSEAGAPVAPSGTEPPSHSQTSPLVVEPTSSKLVEMLFSKKRSSKTDVNNEEGAAGSGDGSKSPGKSNHDPGVDKTSPKSKTWLFGKGAAGKDKKQLSLGKGLTKKEEKETEEDLEFKRQCQIELEKRLNECGFGIHAHIKERQVREKKPKKHSEKSEREKDTSKICQATCRSAATVTNSISNNKDLTITGSPSKTHLSVPLKHHKSDDENVSGDFSEAGVESDDLSDASRTRSLPGQSSTSQSKDAMERFSTSSLQCEPTQPDFKNPARRTKSLLDTFREVKTKSFWKKSHSKHSGKDTQSSSSSYNDAVESVSNQDGAAGSNSLEKCSKHNLNHTSSELGESKASVLNQASVERGNVLRSVVFYQNRFMVMEQTKPRAKKASSTNIKSETKEIPKEKVEVPHNGSSNFCSHNIPERSKSAERQKGRLSLTAEGKSDIFSLKVTHPTGEGHNSGTGEENKRRFSSPNYSAVSNYLNVEPVLTEHMKSESDLQLEAYYNRVQNLQVRPSDPQCPYRKRATSSSESLDATGRFEDGVTRSQRTVVTHDTAFKEPPSETTRRTRVEESRRRYDDFDIPYLSDTTHTNRLSSAGGPCENISIDNSRHGQERLFLKDVRNVGYGQCEDFHDRSPQRVTVDGQRRRSKQKKVCDVGSEFEERLRDSYTAGQSKLKRTGVTKQMNDRVHWDRSPERDTLSDEDDFVTYSSKKNRNTSYHRTRSPDCFVLKETNRGKTHGRVMSSPKEAEYSFYVDDDTFLEVDSLDDDQLTQREKHHHKHHSYHKTDHSTGHTSHRTTRAGTSETDQSYGHHFPEGEMYHDDYDGCDVDTSDHHQYNHRYRSNASIHDTEDGRLHSEMYRGAHDTKTIDHHRYNHRYRSDHLVHDTEQGRLRLHSDIDHTGFSRKHSGEDLRDLRSREPLSALQSSQRRRASDFETKGPRSSKNVQFSDEREMTETFHPRQHESLHQNHSNEDKRHRKGEKHTDSTPSMYQDSTPSKYQDSTSSKHREHRRAISSSRPFKPTDFTWDEEGYVDEIKPPAVTDHRVHWSRDRGRVSSDRNTYDIENSYASPLSSPSHRDSPGRVEYRDSPSHSLATTRHSTRRDSHKQAYR